MHSTDKFAATQRDAVLKSGPIRCADVNNGFTHLVTTEEDKQLKVWGLDGLQVLSERYVGAADVLRMRLTIPGRELPKKPTDTHFTGDGQSILVSDKFGDIFR